MYKEYFKMKLQKQEILQYLLLAILFYVLASQYMQVHEDLSYCFNSADGTPIASFYDAMASQAYCYMNSVARFWVHTFVQYFCSLENKTSFFIISSLMFLILNLGLLFIIRQEFGKRKSDKFLITGWLFLMTPLVGISYLGHIAFVVNYLWASALNVLFIALFIKIKNLLNKKFNTLTVISISILSLFIGGFQESFSICISGALFFYAIVNRKNLSTAEKVMIVAYIIGTTTIVFAPGNIKRFLSSENAGESSFIMRTCFNLGRVLFGYWQVLLFFILSAILLIFKRKVVINFYQKNWVYITALIIFILFTTFIAYTARHQLTCLSLILLILLLKALYSWKVFTGKIETVTTILITVILLGVYYKVYEYRKELKTVYTKFEENAMHSNDSIILAGDFIRFDKEILKDSPFRDFTNITHASSQIYYKNGVNALSNYLSKGENLKLKTVVLPDTPENLIRLCNKNNEISENVYAINSYSFIIKREIADKQSDYFLIIEEEPTSIKGKLLSLLKRKRIEKERMNLDKIDMKFIVDDNIYYYLIADKENNGYKINSIHIERN